MEHVQGTRFILGGHNHGNDEVVRVWALTSLEGSPISRWSMLQQILACSHTGWDSFLPPKYPSVGISIVLSTVFIYISDPLALCPKIS